MTTKAFDYTKLLAKTVPPGVAGRPDAGGRPRYDFATAYPDPDSFPSQGLHEALGRALKDQGRDLALYPHPQGHPALRELIVEKLRRHQGMKVDPDQVILTGGSGPAIGLFTELFTDPGDTLLTEEFVYTGTLAIMRRYHANIVGVGMDGEGMRPDALDQTIRDLERQGKRPKFIYTIPTFENPVGTDMGAKRRRDILSVAQRHGIPIYEDDCYVDLRFEGEATSAIHSYDDSGMVMYSGSFSKIVGPGMRLGFLVASRDLIPRLNAMHNGRPASQFAALATLYYLREHMDDHVEEINAIQRAKRDTMLGAVGEYMGSAAVSTQPKGGLYLWLRLPEGADTVAALEKARSRGVVYGPGPTFSPKQDGRNYLRLCYGYHNLKDTRDGVALLARVFEEDGLLG